MADCPNLEGCAFMKTYESMPEKQLALKGFVRMYCKGERQDACVRKIVKSKLGEGGMVPVNMMPNGFPLPGTHNREWDQNCLSLVMPSQREAQDKLKQV